MYVCTSICKVYKVVYMSREHHRPLSQAGKTELNLLRITIYCVIGVSMRKHAVIYDTN